MCEVMWVGADDVLVKLLELVELECKLIVVECVIVLYGWLLVDVCCDLLIGVGNCEWLLEDFDVLCVRVDRYGYMYWFVLFGVDGLEEVVRAVGCALALVICFGDVFYCFGLVVFAVLLFE